MDFFSTPLGRVVAGILSITPVIVIAAYMSSRPRYQLAAENARSVLSSRDRKVEIGGISRPASDVYRSAQPRKLTDAQRKIDPNAPAIYPFGRSPDLAPDLNPSVAKAYEALQTGNFPERITPLVSPKEFNRADFEANREDYLTTVEPGRVWQAAQPDGDAPPIRAVVPKYHQILQGESVRLRVKVNPDSPVTFTSFDLGGFENRLPSITVVANDEGIAEASFTGISGTVGDVKILASSPEASGRLRFTVTVNAVSS